MDDEATDDDVRWLDAFLQRGLLSNQANLTPRLAEADGRVSPAGKRTVLAAHRAGRWPIAALASSNRYSPAATAFGPATGTPRRYVEVLAPAPFSIRRQRPAGTGER